MLSISTLADGTILGRAWNPSLVQVLQRGKILMISFPVLSKSTPPSSSTGVKARELKILLKALSCIVAPLMKSSCNLSQSEAQSSLKYPVLQSSLKKKLEELHSSFLLPEGPNSSQSCTKVVGARNSFQECSQRSKQEFPKSVVTGSKSSLKSAVFLLPTNLKHSQPISTKKLVLCPQKSDCQGKVTDKYTEESKNQVSLQGNISSDISGESIEDCFPPLEPYKQGVYDETSSNHVHHGLKRKKKVSSETADQNLPLESNLGGNQATNIGIIKGSVKMAGPKTSSIVLSKPKDFYHRHKEQFDLLHSNFFPSQDSDLTTTDENYTPPLSSLDDQHGSLKRNLCLNTNTASSIEKKFDRVEKDVTVSSVVGNSLSSSSSQKSDSRKIQLTEGQIQNSSVGRLKENLVYEGSFLNISGGYLNEQNGIIDTKAEPKLKDLHSVENCCHSSSNLKNQSLHLSSDECEGLFTSVIEWRKFKNSPGCDSDSNTAKYATHLSSSSSPLSSFTSKESNTSEDDQSSALGKSYSLQQNDTVKSVSNSTFTDFKIPRLTIKKPNLEHQSHSRSLVKLFIMDLLKVTSTSQRNYFMFHDLVVHHADVFGVVTGMRLAGDDKVIYEVDDGSGTISCMHRISKLEEKSRKLKRFLNRKRINETVNETEITIMNDSTAEQNSEKEEAYKQFKMCMENYAARSEEEIFCRVGDTVHLKGVLYEFRGAISFYIYSIRKVLNLEEESDRYFQMAALYHSVYPETVEGFKT